jgi:predicted permease
MIEIFNLALPFFGLIFIGMAATKLRSFGEEGLAWLNVFVFYFALPALIFLLVSRAPFEKLIDWPFITATTTATGLVFLIMLAVSMIVLRAPLKTAALLGCAGSYGNVGYMGPPLAVAFFGPQAAVPAALVFCFDCALQFILTPMLAAFGHERDEDVHWGELPWRTVRQVLAPPFIVAPALGGLASWMEFRGPEALETTLQMLMNAAGPVALFAMGVTVGTRKIGRMAAELPAVVFAKLILHPVLALLIVSQVPGIDPLWFHVAVMMAALPTATNAFILASQYRTKVETASSAVIVTTGLSALTVPALIYAIRSGWL